MREKFNHLISSELNLPLIWKWHISFQLCSLALHHMLQEQVVLLLSLGSSLKQAALFFGLKYSVSLKHALCEKKMVIRAQSISGCKGIMPGFCPIKPLSHPPLPQATHLVSYKQSVQEIKNSNHREKQTKTKQVLNHKMRQNHAISR